MANSSYSWDVSSVMYMSSMFSDASAFSQDLSGWVTDNVTACTNFSSGSGLTPAQLPKIHFIDINIS
ncbi:BspA family leucine-rich repeat surface protein [Flavivirga jejuensis]|uniref:BspA family leucine-rich repeat surface protein n=1 Tax=Flavivirga jejuensis TaxID=870487 RepID=UPI00349E87FD